MEKIGSIIKAHCSQCGGDRNCEVKGHCSQNEWDGLFGWWKEWFLLTCRGCDHVFAQTVSTNSEEYYQSYDENGNDITEYIEAVETWPARSKRAIPGWFEHSIIETDLEDTGALNASLRELYGALSADLMVLSSIGIRTSFDIASELLGVDPDLGFGKKLNALVERGYIAEAEKVGIEILIDAGSASAHRGWKPRFSEVDALMTTLEDFIYKTIVFPSQKRAHAAKLAEIDAKVPKKRRRSGKAKAENEPSADTKT